MSGWAWPQYVIAIMFAFSFVHQTVTFWRDRELSSLAVTIWIVFTVTIFVLYAWVLHCGDFW